MEPIKNLGYRDTGENLVIEGDNLQAMISLRPQYRGSVQIAYVDPPYNTGKGDFRYSDRRYYDPDADDDSAVYISNEDGGRHTKWLNYMGPRLYAVQELLADDGVCLVSINDIELFRAGLLLDEIFGERNRLGIIIWKQSADNNPTRIATGHEYILCYAKRIENIPKAWSGATAAKEWMLETYERLRKQYRKDNLKIEKAFQAEVRQHQTKIRASEASGKDYDLVDLGDLVRYTLIDDRGPYAANRTTEKPVSGGYFYDVRNPKTKKIHRRPSRGYRFPETTMLRLQAEKRIIFPDDPTKLVQIKKYLKELRLPLRSIIDIGSRGGAADLKRLFPRATDKFPNPKPTALMELLLSFAGDNDALVLDAWAGSGTTAHAVLRLNEMDCGSRRFILIEEGTPKERFCKTVIAPRLKQAIIKEDLPGGFSFLRLGEKLNRDAILELEREAIANLIAQTDLTGAGRGIERIAGAFVIGRNARREAICLFWNGRRDSTVTAEILAKMYSETDALKLKRPIRVYASACMVGETPSFRFCQIPDEIVERLSLDENLAAEELERA
ncbi:MAG TPA: site-specific DNA-methyltransferase [Candidatus Rubrimentiphilum sp.]|nr:site-specific DNA-methyltransferase [Candidatus Rubrimentiphilum sp.]